MIAPPSAPTSSDSSEQEFAQQASRSGNDGLLRDLWDFMRTNKKWWLTPIILVLMLVGLLVLLSSSAVAPFIYPLF